MKRKPQQSARGAEVEGEGSYTATRRYNAKLRAFEQTADVAGLAASARKALKGPEGPQLKQAEERAKRRAPTAGKAARR
jgi:hypothetical protein